MSDTPNKRMGASFWDLLIVVGDLLLKCQWTSLAPFFCKGKTRLVWRVCCSAVFLKGRMYSASSCSTFSTYMLWMQQVHGCCVLGLLERNLRNLKCSWQIQETNNYLNSVWMFAVRLCASATAAGSCFHAETAECKRSWHKLNSSSSYRSQQHLIRLQLIPARPRLHHWR